MRNTRKPTSLEQFESPVGIDRDLSNHPDRKEQFAKLSRCSTLDDSGSLPEEAQLAVEAWGECKRNLDHTYNELLSD